MLTSFPYYFTLSNIYLNEKKKRTGPTLKKITISIRWKFFWTADAMMKNETIHFKRDVWLLYYSVVYRYNFIIGILYVYFQNIFFVILIKL